MPTAVTRQRGILATMLRVVEFEPALRWVDGRRPRCHRSAASGHRLR
jgi:hypothetical protein